MTSFLLERPSTSSFCVAESCRPEPCHSEHCPSAPQPLSHAARQPSDPVTPVAMDTEGEPTQQAKGNLLNRQLQVKLWLSLAPPQSHLQGDGDCDHSQETIKWWSSSPTFNKRSGRQTPTWRPQSLVMQEASAFMKESLQNQRAMIEQERQRTEMLAKVLDKLDEDLWC